LSVQLAAAIPLVLAVVPLYLALLRLVGPAPAAAACLFFCVLPEVARLGADGISDSTHLFFFCVAFWAIAECLQAMPAARVPWPRLSGHAETADKHAHASVSMAPKSPESCKDIPSEAVAHDGGGTQPGWLLLAGLAVGMAVLARAEVLVLVASLAVAAMVFQLQPQRRLAWQRLAVAIGAFSLGLAIVLGPYLLVVGATTPKSAMARILGRSEVETKEDASQSDAEAWKLADGTPMSFTVREPGISIRQPGYAAGIKGFGRKLADVFGYWIGALALFGVWQLRRSATRRIDRFTQIFFLLFSLAAIRFAATEGYLDARHLLCLVVVGIGCAGYGALQLGRMLAARFKRMPALATWSVVVLAAVGCLPSLLVPLHHSRLGHLAAAHWLATEADTPGAVMDTSGWTGLYSGRQTYGYADARRALCDRRLAYFVVEEQELHHKSDRSRTLRYLTDLAGEAVARFPLPADEAANRQPVIVYRWYPERFR